MLRTAAYLIASCRRTRQPQATRAVRVMLTALAGLARTLAGLRAAPGPPPPGRRRGGPVIPPESPRRPRRGI